VSAEILRVLLSIGHERSPNKTNKAVITVPAYFNDGQREDTLRAAKEAGIEVLRLVSEPTAAAFAERGARPRISFKTTLIYDFGGGTLDVSLLEIDANRVRVLATSGDTALGGGDFDAALYAYVVSQLTGAHKTVIDEGDKDACNGLRAACVRAKVQLSTATSAQLIVGNFSDDEDLVMTIDRAAFERQCEGLFEKCLFPVYDVLRHAKIGASAVTTVVLVGGTARIPMVQEKIKGLFPGKDVEPMDPQKVVVQGAALLAAKLTGCAALERLSLQEVSPLTIGVRVRWGAMHPVIRRGTPLPIQQQTFKLQTTEHNQTRMSVDVYEGERKAVAHNHLLATVIVENIPEGEARSQEVIFSFSITANGILSVTYTCSGYTDARQMPVAKNPWHYTSDELNGLLVFDAKEQAADDQFADGEERRWRRRMFGNAFITFTQASEWRECGEEEERSAIAREITQLCEDPTWEQLFHARDLLRHFWTSHGHIMRPWMYWERPSEFPR
jgi:molecular chaperone DnaK (HSP70)